MSGLDAMHDPPAWWADAACRQHPEVDFFPDRGDNRGIDQCKDICSGCPSRRPCREAGLYEKFGIWGGLSERERRRRRKALGIVLLDDRDPNDPTTREDPTP